MSSFRRSGDALVGRYSLFHMLPLSLSEAAGTPRNTCFLAGKNPVEAAESLEREVEGKAGPSGADALDSLLRYGPFPESFIQQDERFSRIWHRDYISLCGQGKIAGYQPVLAVESKTGDTALAPSLANRKKWFPENTPPAIQVVAPPGILQKHPSRTWVMSLDRLLGLLL